MAGLLLRLVLWLLLRLLLRALSLLAGLLLRLLLRLLSLLAALLLRERLLLLLPDLLLLRLFDLRHRAAAMSLPASWLTFRELHTSATCGASWAGAQYFRV